QELEATNVAVAVVDEGRRDPVGELQEAAEVAGAGPPGQAGVDHRAADALDHAAAEQPQDIDRVGRLVVNGAATVPDVDLVGLAGTRHPAGEGPAGQRGQASEAAGSHDLAHGDEAGVEAAGAASDERHAV